MKAFLFYFGTIVLVCLEVYGRAINKRNTGTNIDLEAYLQKYGYMARSSPNNVGVFGSEPDISQSLRKFQEWNKLAVTGVLDAETQKLMSTPRCGVPDPQIIQGMPQQFVLGPKWTKSKLTYKISNFSPDLASNVIRTETSRAFKFWTDVANLEISESTGTTDIEILFGSGDHGDNAPFDGAGGVLAHATFPEDGQCHFDDGETWVANATGTDYFIVAAHEIGHLLGLDHSNTRSALMYPFYTGYIADYTIDDDDKAAIVAHYGANTMQDTTTQSNMPTEINPGAGNTASITTAASPPLALVFILLNMVISFVLC